MNDLIHFIGNIPSGALAHTEVAQNLLF